MKSTRPKPKARPRPSKPRPLPAVVVHPGQLIMPTASAAPVAWSREAPPPPAGMLVYNPEALAVGRAFRVLTADQTVRDGTTGEVLGCFSPEVLGQFVVVFAARTQLGEGAPRIDHNHGPSRGLDPTIIGAVVGCYVADDGERGPGLYVVPGWTEHGRAFVERHATPAGGSLLTNSPEFFVGPCYARSGGGPGEPGALLGGAELYGVAVTGAPQQSERIIDPVRLSRAVGLAAEAEEVPGMDPAIEERFAALEAGAAESDAKLDKVLAAVEALAASKAGMVAEVVELAAEPMADAVAELLDGAAEDMIAEAVAVAIEGATPEAVAIADAEIPPEDIVALSRRGHPLRAAALVRRLAAIGRAKGTAERRAYSKRLAAVEAQATASRCDADMAALRATCMSAADEPHARDMWAIKHSTDPAVRAAFASVKKHPYDRLLEQFRDNPTVLRGVAGVRGELQTGGPPTRESIRAWCRSQAPGAYDYDKDPGRATTAWSIATGINYKEVRG